MKIIKIILSVVCLLEILLISFTIIFVASMGVIYSFKIETKINDIDKYLKTNGFVSKFSIFPDSVEDLDGVEQYHYYDGLLANGEEIFLEIVYSSEDFKEERKRIESTVSLYSGKSVKFDNKKLFNFKTYVSIYNDQGKYEYACLDEESSRIVYISLRRRNVESVGFDPQFLPLEYCYLYESEDTLKFNMYEKHEDVWLE